MSKNGAWPIPDGFTPWHGGVNPVQGKTVRVVMRSLAGGGLCVVPKIYPANDLNWDKDPSSPYGEILAYKVLA